jgi:hypothetical protein
MKLTFRHCLFVAFIVFTNSEIYAQIITSQTRTDGWALPKSDLMVKLYGAMPTASGFYNANGELIDRFREASDDDSVRQKIVRDYSVKLAAITGGIYAEYGILDNFTIVADVPVTYWNLHERYSFDSSYVLRLSPTDSGVVTEPVKRDRANLNRFRPDYYGLGGRYAWTNGNNLIGVNGIVRVPPGFKNVFSADSSAFFTDEFLQASGGLNLGLKINKNWLSTSINYNYRAGDYSDEMQYYLEFGTRNVETTQIVVFSKYIQSLGSFQESAAFEPRRQRFQENYLLVGGIFEIEFQKRLAVNAGYEIRLAGKNSWALSTFTLAVAYKFREL